MVRRQSGSSRSSPIGTSPTSNERRKPFLIGVAGGTASGKTTVCEKIMEAVLQGSQNSAVRKIIAISQDSFYRDLTEEESAKAVKGLFNFDHPDAFDMELMESCLLDIHEGKSTTVPVYDIKKNARVTDEVITITSSDVVLVEGILVFYHSKIRDIFDMKLFVDTDADTRLARRVSRDISERGRDLDLILNQYTTFVKSAFEEFCLPTKKFADIIIPRGAENTVAIQVIVQHIQDILDTSHGTRQRHKSDSVFDFRPH